MVLHWSAAFFKGFATFVNNTGANGGVFEIRDRSRVDLYYVSWFHKLQQLEHECCFQWPLKFNSTFVSAYVDHGTQGPSRCDIVMLDINLTL